MKLNILHEDSDIIVAVKPCGVPTQPDKTNSESMVSMLKLRIYEKENRKEEPYLVPIHRLDRPVGGVMVFAKTPEAAANLSKQSEDGSMMKYYQAILTGELPNDQGMLKDYLLHDTKDNVTKVVDKDTPGAKYSELEYEVLDVMDTDENSRLSLSWNLNREISKLNYRIHTDAIKKNLIPPELTQWQISNTYASEADLLNTVLFGKTAKEWRDEKKQKDANIRDDATLNQLLVLANLESYNAILIEQGKSQAERMQLLHDLAVQQMRTLNSMELSELPGIEKK